MKLLSALLGTTLLLVFGGCSTVNTRIKEHSATFASLDATVQARLRLGRVDIGDTLDMAYIALGRPEARITRNGHTIWIYQNYFQELAGTAFVGYNRVVLVDPATKRTYVRLDPLYTNVYRERTEEYIRLIFNDGKIEAIEQEKGA